MSGITPKFKIEPPSNSVSQLLLNKLKKIEEEEEKFFDLFEFISPKLEDVIDDTRDLFKILREPRQNLTKT